MDIRIQKTQAAIKNAFFELRAQKSVEKITVKELCQRAQINKSTFYTHYDDIYALSDAMQAEAIAFVLGTISLQEHSLRNPGAFTRAIYQAVFAHKALIDGLFAPHERTRLGNALEEGIRRVVYQNDPERRGDVELNILLSYSIQGAYHAYLNNQGVDQETLVRVIETINETLRPLFGRAAQNHQKSP